MYSKTDKPQSTVLNFVHNESTTAEIAATTYAGGASQFSGNQAKCCIVPAIGTHQCRHTQQQHPIAINDVDIIVQVSNRSRYDLWLLTLFAIGLVIWNSLVLGIHAAPQSCILCDKEDLKAKDPNTSYEEFLFEHQVTRQDAINALKALNESFYSGPSPQNSCKSVTCTNAVMKYCVGPQFINDHCWCELGHTDEGLPFVPHICYVGEKVYTASVGSCFFYEEVKECCCAPVLAKRWRHISGAAALSPFGRYVLHAISLTLVLLSGAGHRIRFNANH